MLPKAEIKKTNSTKPRQRLQDKYNELCAEEKERNRQDQQLSKTHMELFKQLLSYESLELNCRELNAGFTPDPNYPQKKRKLNALVNKSNCITKRLMAIREEKQELRKTLSLYETNFQNTQESKIILKPN